MPSSIRTTLIRALCLTLYMHVVTGQNLADDRLSLVRTRLQESANRSWELGTAAQALLEIDAPSWSVFSRNSLPPPQQVPSDAQSSVAPVFTLAQEIVGNRSRLNSNAEGPQPLMPDASAADPAANGVSVLLANWTGQGGQDYAGAARDQLDFLLERVPRTDDGAISHREAEVQLWSDFVYMVPPFLAYYGVLTRNQSLVTEAYNQIRLYRQYLRDDDNLWKHIAMGGEVAEDNGHWTTGNGWAAAGMLRVLATIQNSEYDRNMVHQQADLAHWVGEIHGAIYPLLDDTNIFPNYASRAVNDSGNFYDAAGTALLAATVYRVSLYWGDHSHISFAQRCRETLYADNGNQSHINAEGWLQPVVNPHSFGVEGSRSPEAQAFVLDLEAAYRDWVNEGSNGSTHLTISNLWIWAGIVSSLLLWV
ncbi:hypothetical protein AB1N83_011516 [Pleurotus pulmonarius]|nr:hypothetical protein EYR38_010045 [Pleurotus pulmonarius]